MAPCHIVVLPFAQQGHINPLLQLSKKLAGHGGGLVSITFVLSENTVPQNPNPNPNLSFAGVPDLLPRERSRGSVFRDSVDSMVNMEAGFRDFLRQLHLHTRPVSAIIFDVFMAWCPAIAAELRIPCLGFFTSNATSTALLCHLPSLIEAGVLPFPRDGNGKLISEEKVRGIPGVMDLLPEDFPLCTTFDGSHFRFRFMSSLAASFRSTGAIIVNTVEELEGSAARAIREEAKKELFAVGPLLLLGGSEAPVKRLDVNYWAEDEHCIEWLSKQAPASVLYVSLGSVASLTLDQFGELAAGLEATNLPFLWVVRPDSIELPLHEALPKGFSDRTQGRGLIISWGPQLMILSHPSVGAFLTHGGWNSIIENLAMGPLPMICWPHVAEQRLNRRIIVDLWKLGLGFEQDTGAEDGSIIGRAEIARVVKEAIEEGEARRELRSAAENVRGVIRKSVSEGGSSYANFERLLEYLLHLND